MTDGKSQGGMKHWQVCEIPDCQNDVPTSKGICDSCAGATEQCAECGEPPKGVTMAPIMDGWSCPYCGHYNTKTYQEADR